MQYGKSTLAVVAAFAIRCAHANSIYDIAAGSDKFTTLTAAVDAAGLKETLQGSGTYTVFAPTDDGFSALPTGTVEKLLKPEWVFHLKDVLLYHTLGDIVKSTDLTDGLVATTLNNEDITINLDPPRVNTNSNILLDMVDIEADNGVIHAVDNVLLPTSVTSNIVEIAAGDSDFSTLVAAVKAAGLVDALSGDGPLTVFAPTNAAFEALPEGTLDSLLLPENKQQLADILTYHVVAGNAHSTTLSDGSVTTLNGAKVEISTDGGVMVDDATVTTADIYANNDIIHVIDKVILPEEDEDEEPTSDSAANVLSAGVVAVGLIAALF
uniref:FAS1 domain-containing protein n=1 Tax=Helicotheca tamesis TaxID=374047 RepID=A0A7S2GS47_9STRA